MDYFENSVLTHEELINLFPFQYISPGFMSLITCPKVEDNSLRPKMKI